MRLVAICRCGKRILRTATIIHSRPALLFQCLLLVALTVNAPVKAEEAVPLLPLEDGALDPMGYQLQLRRDIEAGERDMTYRVIDKGDYDSDRFAVIDEETLNRDGAAITTLKAEKVRDSDSKRKTLMWFATDQDYLLVRLLQVEPDGSEYALSIDEAKFKP